MYEVPSAARAVIGWGPARATELVCGYRYFPLSAEGGIPAAGRECSMLLHVRSILRGERELSRGWAAIGLLRSLSGQLERSRAEQSRAEQSRAEQSRAEQSRAEQSRAEQSRAEQSRAEQSRAKQVPATCLRVENTVRGCSILGACHAASCQLLEREQQGLTHGAFGVARAGCCFIFV
jgi:hypothetical protein